MGATTSKTSQTLVDKLKNELEAKGYSSANCTAVQKNIIRFKKSTNCNVTGENQCIADANVDSVAMAAAMIEVAQQASTDQKMSGIVFGQFNTDIQNTTQVRNRVNEIKQSCEAKSEVELEQYNEIRALECKDADVIIVQGGNAQASCMLRAIQQDFIDSAQTSDSKSEIKGINIAMSALCCGAPCIILCVLIGGGMMGGDNVNTGGSGKQALGMALTRGGKFR